MKLKLNFVNSIQNFTNLLHLLSEFNSVFFLKNYIKFKILVFLFGFKLSIFMKFISFAQKTALHIAVQNKNAHIVQQLLKYKEIDVNYKYISILKFFEFNFKIHKFITFQILSYTILNYN